MIAAIGAMVVMGAAPVDDFWHRAFGRDVDVWSFPHLVALVGGCGINIGGALAARQAREPGRYVIPLTRLELLFLTALLWVAMFGLNWYTLVLARLRDSLEYPLLAIAVATPVLLLAAVLLGRGGATATAVTYMTYTAAAHQLLHVAGFALLPFPPILIVPAVAVDFAMSARISPNSETNHRRGMVAGALFAPLFIAAEAGSLAWYPHPAVPPPVSDITLGYYTAALDRPWDPQHLALTVPLGLAVGTLAGWVGGKLGDLLLLLEARIRSESAGVEPDPARSRAVRVVR